MTLRHMMPGIFLSRWISHRGPHRTLLAPLLSFLIVAAAAVIQPAHGQAWGEPHNIGETKQHAIAYHDSGAYARDLAEVAARAENYVRFRAGQVTHPALVLDIDETSLSNWAEIRANDFGYI